MEPVYSNLEEVIASNSFNAVMYASIALAILTTISVIWKKPKAIVKKLLFISICAITVGVTAYLAYVTIYLNSISVSGGPVHYHADMEIWTCNQSTDLNLRDPKGLSNKIGTATLHEHNDKRIHLEGVVVEENDQSLGKFFHVIGGSISPNKLVIPTNDGTLSLEDGQTCYPGNAVDVETPGKLQVFVYKTITLPSINDEERKTFVQSKVADPINYLIAPESQVPPGDCIIIEFGVEKEKTDKLCTSFKAAIQTGKLEAQQ